MEILGNQGGLRVIGYQKIIQVKAFDIVSTHVSRVLSCWKIGGSVYALKPTVLNLPLGGCMHYQWP